MSLLWLLIHEPYTAKIPHLYSGCQEKSGKYFVTFGGDLEKLAKERGLKFAKPL